MELALAQNVDEMKQEIRLPPEGGVNGRIMPKAMRVRPSACSRQV